MIVRKNGAPLPPVVTESVPYESHLVLNGYGHPRFAVGSRERAERLARLELNDRIVHVREVPSGHPCMCSACPERFFCATDLGVPGSGPDTEAKKAEREEAARKTQDAVERPDRVTIRCPTTSAMAKRIGMKLRLEAPKALHPDTVVELYHAADHLLGEVPE